MRHEEKMAIDLSIACVPFFLNLLDLVNRNLKVRVLTAPVAVGACAATVLRWIGIQRQRQTQTAFSIPSSAPLRSCSA
jgi:hypothetical protein